MELMAYADSRFKWLEKRTEAVKFFRALPRKGSMTSISKPPIFCDDCASLALATLDDAPLCAKCLQKILDRNQGKLMDRIAPLIMETETWCCEIPEIESIPPEG